MEIEGLDELNIESSVNTEEAQVPEPQGEGQDADTPDTDDTQDTTDGVPGGEGTGTVTDDETPAPDASGDKEKKDDQKPEEVETAELTGIESYLSQFDIEGGMIEFEDGTRTHFNDLEADKQKEVLTQLHDTQAVDIEQRYGLDEQEVGLINYLREQGTTIDEVIDQMASQRAQTYLMSQQVQTMDVSKLDNDAVYTAFLLKGNPEATAEQLEKDLETAKKMSNYEGTVENLRKDFTKEQTAYLEQQQQAELQELQQEIEAQRKEVVDVISNLKEVDGLSLNDGIKNEVFDLILNVDESGDSLFMSEVFSEPEKLFKAAFWYKNGKDIVQAREEFWRKEKSAAYKRGLEDSKLGKKTFTNSDLKSNATTQHYGEDNLSSLDDLY